MQSDNVELQRTFLSATDSFVECAKPVSILSVNEVVNVFADHHVSAIGTHHPKAGQIHVNQSAIGSDELYTFRCGLNNGTETLLAVALPGVVEKIVKPIAPSEPEKAQIVIQGADHLYREIRVENTLENAAGEKVRLKPGAEVDVTIEAPAESVEKKPT